MVEKLEMQTKDLSQEKIRVIGELFPNCITESKEGEKTVLSVDFDALKQELSDNIVEGIQERYQFTWPDKSKAKRLANTPTTMTLRPCREESVDFDNTKSLYMEGDNLEVLKILRETYLGKVKMIYIDPPYNTGKDFVYHDSFKQTDRDYLEVSGNYDENGNCLIINPSTNGKYHTNWLNMMYPRLSQAKDFLSEDGIIFISIDDHELYNLKKICDEIFGESNYITKFIWEKGKEGGNDSSIMRTHYDNVLCYCKNCNSEGIINLDDKDTSRHIKVLPEPNLVKGIKSEINEGELFQLINLSKQKDYTVQIPLIDGSIITWPSYSPQSSIDRWISEGRLFVGKKRVPYVKSFLKDEIQGQKPSNIITQEWGTTKAGSIEIRDILGNKDIFSYPKPSIFIKRLLKIGSKKDSIILDFFSGSATTAHAVMQLNAEDGGHRKYILIQLNEKCPVDSEAYKAGYGNICEIGKERIRRAGRKIKEEYGKEDLDVGFRVFKCDSSNMKDIYYSPELLVRDNLDGYGEAIKNDRRPEDLLVQVMLELGIELSSKIKKREIGGHFVFSVDDGYLAACFDDSIDDFAVVEISKEMSGCMYAVFRSGSSMSDEMLANIEQIFKTYSPQTKIRIL